MRSKINLIVFLIIAVFINSCEKVKEESSFNSSGDDFNNDFTSGKPCGRGIISDYNEIVSQCEQIYCHTNFNNCLGLAKKFVSKYPNANCAVRDLGTGALRDITTKEFEDFIFNLQGKCQSTLSAIESIMQDSVSIFTTEEQEKIRKDAKSYIVHVRNLLPKTRVKVVNIPRTVKGKDLSHVIDSYEGEFDTITYDEHKETEEIVAVTEYQLKLGYYMMHPLWFGNKSMNFNDRCNFIKRNVLTKIHPNHCDKDKIDVCNNAVAMLNRSKEINDILGICENRKAGLLPSLPDLEGFNDYIFNEYLKEKMK